MTNDRLLKLVRLYKAKEISEEESFELHQWIEASEGNRREFLRLTDAEGIKHYMQFKTRMAEVLDDKRIPVRTIAFRYYFRRMAAVAAVLVLALVGIYIWRDASQGSRTHTINTNLPTTVSDVAPGRFKAKLTLAGGQEILLDTLNQGLLARQDHSEIVGNGNQIEYSAHAIDEGPLTYNTLQTNTGETYPVKLSDGTMVWLNSSSSIRFPVAFRGAERKVEITGEVYFEVKKNKTPFKVLVNKKKNSFEVNVLGTHFNVNAYDDEADSKTSLLEGRVAVKMLDRNEVINIKPGQQASVNDNGNGNIKVLNNINMDVIVAWKDQTFYFESTELKSVMRQLSRWYGLNIKYEANVPSRHFNGMVSRNRNLSEVLKNLASSDIHFTIEGKNLIVKP